MTFNANKPLPDSLNTRDLDFDAVLARAGDNLESVDFPDPTFTEPRITPDRQSVKFTVCLTPGSIPPGKYVGSVTLGGPPGLSAASVSITANAKRSMAYWGFRCFLALLVALALLVLKDAAAYKKANPAANWWSWPPWIHSFKDPLWLATTAFALAAAFGTLYALYHTNPAWGSEGFSDFASMLGASFAAVGGHTIISTLTPG